MQSYVHEILVFLCRAPEIHFKARDQSHLKAENQLPAICAGNKFYIEKRCTFYKRCIITNNYRLF
jgi:hypothetical protein